MQETPGAEMWELRSYKSTWVVLVVLVVVTAVIVVAALLVGRSGAPDFNGYWQSGPVQEVVIRLEGSDGSYRMSGIGMGEVTLHPSETSSSTLTGEIAYQGGTAKVRLAINGKGDQLILSLTAGEASQPAGTATLTRIPGSLEEVDAHMAAQLAAGTTAAKQSAVKEGIHALQVAVQSWAVDHGDRYPDPSIVAKDKPLGDYLDRWPRNPYTEEPMTQGADPGDFTYEQLDGGASFKLTGHFDGGGSFTVP